MENNIQYNFSILVKNYSKQFNGREKHKIKIDRIPWKILYEIIDLKNSSYNYTGEFIITDYPNTTIQIFDILLRRTLLPLYEITINKSEMSLEVQGRIPSNKFMVNLFFIPQYNNK